MTGADPELRERMVFTKMLSNDFQILIFIQRCEGKHNEKKMEN